MKKEELISMVLALQNGEEGSEAALYNTFREDLYHYILKTVKDSELATDLTQDAFIEIFQTIGSLREPAAFVTWSRTIAYHKCTAYFRKRRELLLDESEDGYSVFDSVVEEREEYIPDEALDKEEFKKTIRAMIESLPEEQRSAIMMRYFEEISVKEIAEIQGVTEGTVKSRLNYGRKAIKQFVEEYEDKNGVKLHIKGVIPLLLWLFRQYKIANDLSLTAKNTTHAVTSNATVNSTTTSMAKEGIKASIKGLIKKVTITAIVTGSVVAGTMALPDSVKNSVLDVLSSESDLAQQIDDWENLDSDDMQSFLSKILYYTHPEGYHDFDNIDDEAFIRYTGLPDRSKVKSGAMVATDPEMKFYALLLQVTSKEDVDALANQMKTNLHPSEWTWYDEQQDGWIEAWSDVSVDDFTFYTKDEFIFVSYVEQSLVDNGEKRSIEDMNNKFVKIIEMRNRKITEK